MITPETLNALARQAAADSQAHGYEDHLKPVTRTLHKAAFEVAEAVNAYRDSRYCTKSIYEDAKALTASLIESEWAIGINKKVDYEKFVKDTVQDELADAAIYILVAAGNINADFTVPNRTTEYAIRRLIGDRNGDFITVAANIIYTLTDVNRYDNDLWSSLLSYIDYLTLWLEQLTGEDLEYYIREKMAYNQQRPYRHGRDNDPTL